MHPQCLICESSAVISQDSARAMVQLITVLNGFVRGLQIPPPTESPHPVEPTVWLLQNMTTAVNSATLAFRGSDTFIQDMQKYQFGLFTCSCLRCGARFDSVDP